MTRNGTRLFAPEMGVARKRYARSVPRCQGEVKDFFSLTKRAESRRIPPVKIHRDRLQLCVANALAWQIPEGLEFSIQLGNAEAHTCHFLACHDAIHDGLVDFDTACI